MCPLFCLCWSSPCYIDSVLANEDRKVRRESVDDPRNARKVLFSCKRQRSPCCKLPGPEWKFYPSPAFRDPELKKLFRFSFCQAPENWFLFSFNILSCLIPNPRFPIFFWLLTLSPIVVGTEYLLGGGLSVFTLNGVRLPKPKEYALWTFDLATSDDW